MSKHQDPKLPPVVDFNRSPHVPSEPINCRHSILPHGVGVSHVQFPAHPWQFVVPPLAEDHLVLHVKAVMNLRGKIVRTFQVTSKPGDIYIVPHGEATEWRHEGAGQILLLFLAPTLLADTALEVLDIDSSRVNLVERVATSDLLIQAIGQTLLNELQTAGIIGPLYTESLTNTLLMHLLARYSAIPQTPPACQGRLATPTLRRIFDYINSNLEHDLTLAEIAREANLSPYHFTRLFKQSTGESLHQYVIRQRVEAAKRLLLDEQLPIAEVANKVGFADQSHLGRHLKRLLGVTPQSLIKEGKNLPNQRKNLQDSTPKRG